MHLKKTILEEADDIFKGSCNISTLKKPSIVAKSSVTESLEVIQNLSILASVVFWLVIYLSFECERQESTYTDKNCVLESDYFTDRKTGPKLFLWSALHKHFFLAEWQQEGYLFHMKIQGFFNILNTFYVPISCCAWHA